MTDRINFFYGEPKSKKQRKRTPNRSRFDCAVGMEEGEIHYDKTHRIVVIAHFAVASVVFRFRLRREC